MCSKFGFGSGFLSAGLSAASAPLTAGIQDSTEKAVIRGLIGGTISEASGGKFANGAATTAMQSIMEDGILRAATNDRSRGPERTNPDEIQRVAAQATKDANDAIADLVGHAYKTLNDAANAWAAAVVPIENADDAEIASRFFKVSGGYAFGSAVSDGLRYSVNPDGSRLSGALLTAGWIHTHPTSELFSANDLDYSRRMYTSVNGWFAGGIDQPAFVAINSGAVYRWNVSEWWSSGGASWKNPAYYHRVGP